MPFVYLHNKCFIKEKYPCVLIWASLGRCGPLLPLFAWLPHPHCFIKLCIYLSQKINKGHIFFSHFFIWYDMNRIILWHSHNFLRKYLLCKYTNVKTISWLLYCFFLRYLKTFDSVNERSKLYHCSLGKVDISKVWFYNLFLTGYVVLVNVKLS